MNNSCRHILDPEHEEERHNPHAELEYEEREMNTVPMEKRDPNKTFAQLLKDLKAYLRMTNTELAEHFGVSGGTMDAWLYGRNTPLSTMRRKIEAEATKHGLTIPE